MVGRTGSGGGTGGVEVREGRHGSDLTVGLKDPGGIRLGLVNGT